MGKKKETIQDILDRINEDIETIRDKVEELENHNVILMTTLKMRMRTKSKS